MADRYWVGVTQNWNVAAHWASSSAGVGGAGIPTASDDVYFDGNGYVIAWSTAPITTLALTMTASASEFVLLDQGGTISGDFSEANGYFGPIGGGGYTVEFKGNWLFSGGTFAVGTGVGVDPTCDFSGTGKTFKRTGGAGATFQHLTFSGGYTISGSMLIQASVSQDFDISGTVDVSGSIGVQLNGSWAGQTGDITIASGSPYIKFNVDTATNMTTDTGTIGVRVEFHVEDDFTLPARTFDGDVWVEFEVDQKTFTLGAGRHYFNGAFKTWASNVAITTSAKIDCVGEFTCADSWTVDRDSFKQPSEFILDWGNGTHIFYDDLQLGLFGAATNMSMTTGDSTIILRLIKNQGYTYRLSRVVGGFPGTYQELTWNKIYMLRSRADLAKGCRFIEGFVCHDGRFELYNNGAVAIRFRNYQLIPQHDTEFDKLTVIGIDETMPFFGYPLVSAFGWHSIIDINERADIFSTSIAKLKSIPTDIDAWNSELWASDVGLTSGVAFYDRDVRRIPAQRNTLNSRRRITPTPPPELIIQQLIDKALA